MPKHRTSFNITLLALVVLLPASCNRTNNSHPPASKPVVTGSAINPVQPVAGEDPFFVASTDTFSTHGPYSITRTIIQDRNHNIWLATWQGIICYNGKTFTNITLKENLRHYHVFSILETKKGTLWFSTIGGGAYRYDGKSFINFTIENGLADNHIDCMLEDATGNIWCRTREAV